ncbi:MAG: hypothetical protein AABY22_13140 [Nanoarchaeota archaeon]|mgnify:CR=1 FL=1
MTRCKRCDEERFYLKEGICIYCDIEINNKQLNGTEVKDFIPDIKHKRGIEIPEKCI